MSYLLVFSCGIRFSQPWNGVDVCSAFLYSLGLVALHDREKKKMKKKKFNAKWSQSQFLTKGLGSMECRRARTGRSG